MKIKVKTKEQNLIYVGLRFVESRKPDGIVYIIDKVQNDAVLIRTDVNKDWYQIGSLAKAVKAMKTGKWIKYEDKTKN